MSPTELTSVGALLVSIVAAVGLPLWFRRQTTKQLKTEREETARQIKVEREGAAKEVARRHEIAKIREDAQRDAAATAGDTVTWEKMNRALATAAKEERAAHREQIMELRANFTTETERIKALTDRELDKVKEENGKLASQVQELTRQIGILASRGER